MSSFKDGLRRSDGTRIAPGWKNLLGQNVLTCDSHNVHNVIAEAIKQHEDLTGIPYEAQAVVDTPTSAGEESLYLLRKDE